MKATTASSVIRELDKMKHEQKHRTVSVKNTETISPKYSAHFTPYAYCLIIIITILITIHIVANKFLAHRAHT